jgi:protein-S-isoprenylcysteine O-methyltransferase Ste14
MENETLFRILLAVLLVAFVAHRGYYTRKLARPDSQVVKARANTPLTVLASVLSLVALLATAIYLVAPGWVAWARLPLPVWLRWVGLGVVLAGFALLQWSHNALSRNWSDQPRLLADQTLVTSGPYRRVRHPIYTAFLLILSAPALLSANWLVGLAWIGSTALEVASRVRFEEALLAETFGERYRAYARQTGRLWPHL